MHIDAAHELVVQALEAVAALGHPVIRPPGAELLAAQGELPHELSQLGIVGVAPGIQAQGAGHG